MRAEAWERLFEKKFQIRMMKVRKMVRDGYKIFEYFFISMASYDNLTKSNVNLGCGVKCIKKFSSKIQHEN